MCPARFTRTTSSRPPRAPQDPSAPGGLLRGCGGRCGGSRGRDGAMVRKGPGSAEGRVGAMPGGRALPGAVGALCRAMPTRARLVPETLRRAKLDRPQAVRPGGGSSIALCLLAVKPMGVTAALGVLWWWWWSRYSPLWDKGERCWAVCEQPRHPFPHAPAPR